MFLCGDIHPTAPLRVSEMRVCISSRTKSVSELPPSGGRQTAGPDRPHHPPVVILKSQLRHVLDGQQKLRRKVLHLLFKVLTRPFFFISRPIARGSILRASAPESLHRLPALIGCHMEQTAHRPRPVSDLRNVVGVYLVIRQCVECSPPIPLGLCQFRLFALHRIVSHSTYDSSIRLECQHISKHQIFGWRSALSLCIPGCSSPSCIESMCRCLPLLRRFQNSS